MAIKKELDPPKRILITGGAGFIGHHLVDYVLKRTDWGMVVLDRLDLSGNLNRLEEVLGDNKGRVKFVYHDLKSPLNEFVARDIGKINYVVHLAASTHVDRSIENPNSFFEDNVIGTVNLLNWARTQESLKKFINFGTDEVFGPAEPGFAHGENEPFRPSNPYSASKAGQWAAGYAYSITYGLPVVSTFTMNNFGERQHPEKLLPKCIRSVINQSPMPIFAELGEDGELKGVGSRYWLHCLNTASAIKFLLEHGKPRESYNIIGFDELTNLDICQKIATIIGKPLIPDLVDFHKTRPGHDRRYALDGTKIMKMGWKPEISFEDSLRQTVEWTVNNQRWL